MRASYTHVCVRKDMVTSMINNDIPGIILRDVFIVSEKRIVYGKMGRFRKKSGF